MSVASQASTSAATAMEASSTMDPEKQEISPQEVLAEPTEKEADPNVVNWDGDNDPENPQNWTPKKKWTTGGLLAGITFVT